MACLPSRATTTSGCAFPTAAWTARRTMRPTYGVFRFGCSACRASRHWATARPRARTSRSSTRRPSLFPAAANSSISLPPRRTAMARSFKYLFKRYGLLGAPRQLSRMIKVAGKPFGGFATEPLFSALPMANGPYAVRVRLVPASSNGTAEPWKPARIGPRDFSARLARQPLHWDLQLQFFASEELTPIEDARVNWPTPYTTVARLMLPQQDTAAPEGLPWRSRSKPRFSIPGRHWPNTGPWATCSGPAKWSISKARRAAARPEPCSSVGYRLHGVRGFAHRIGPGEAGLQTMRQNTLRNNFYLVDFEGMLTRSRYKGQLRCQSTLTRRSAPDGTASTHPRPPRPGCGRGQGRAGLAPLDRSLRRARTACGLPG